MIIEPRIASYPTESSNNKMTHLIKDYIPNKVQRAGWYYINCKADSKPKIGSEQDLVEIKSFIPSLLFY